MTTSALSPPRWGTDIVEGRVNGHPCRIYAERPRAMSDLLIDAQRWADRPFLVQGDRRMTGAQHAQAVARVADALRRLGLRRGDRVLLQGFNDIEWLVGFWAIQCVGATAVLANAWWSTEETAYAIDLVRPAVFVTDRGDPARAGVQRLPLRELREIVDEDRPMSLSVEPAGEEAPAVVIFSSGTTGNAKGVVMSHRSVIANIHNLMRMTGRLPSELDASHPGTVSLVTMPLFHLGGMQISILTMLSGGKVVFPEGRFDPVQVLRLIENEKVRAWGSVPTMVARVIQHERFADHDVSSVSSVQMGGAAIPHELRALVQKSFPKCRQRVGSMYGLTEAGGVLAAGSGRDIEDRPGCVGRPLPSVEIRIANRDAKGVGEIMARTSTAVSGYLGDATPITDAEGWIASGDLGRLDDDGLLYVVGRSKDIIIRGGENVASLHVERCLRTHPDVVEVAVVPLPHPDLGEEVGAAIVLRQGAAPSIDDLRAYAARQLAKFEIPSRWWLRFDPLPTNATGKIVKREVLARWPESA